MNCDFYSTTNICVGTYRIRPATEEDSVMCDSTIICTYSEYPFIGYNSFSKIWQINWIFVSTCIYYCYWEIVMDEEL